MMQQVKYSTSIRWQSWPVPRLVGAPALGAMISLAVMTVLVLGSLVEAIRELL
jgi:hypothetical protein